MSKKTLSEKLYLFAAQRNWTWLVKLLLWAEFIQGDQLFVTTDKTNQHSALYYALSHGNKALAEQLLDKTTHASYNWHEFSFAAQPCYLQDLLSQAIKCNFVLLFDQIETNFNLVLKQKIKEVLTQPKLDCPHQNTLFDDAIRNTADDDLELIRCLSKIISHKNPSLVADPEQTYSQAIQDNNTALLKVLQNTAGMTSPLDAPTQAPSPDAHLPPAKQPAMIPLTSTTQTTGAAAQQAGLRGRPIQ